MRSLVAVVGKGLAPHLRSLMGAWWVAQFDPYREAADAAKASFQAAFSGEKRMEALVYCVDDIFAYLSENLKLTPQTLSDKTTPLEESAEKHELVICSSLLAMTALLDVLFASMKMGSAETTQVQLESSSNGFHNLDAERVDLSSLRSASLKLANDHKLFRDFVKSQSPHIRSAAYQALRALVENTPEAFTAGELETAAKIVLGAFAEKDRSCHQSMWDMLLTFSKKFPQAWVVGSVRKVVLPRFWAFLRHGCYGSQQISSTCLLPLLSLIPTNAVMPVQEFLFEYFHSLWQGCKTGTSSNDIILLKAFKECFIWIIINVRRYVDEESEMKILQFFLINDVLFKILWRNYTESRTFHSHTTDVKSEMSDGNWVSPSNTGGKSLVDGQVANQVAGTLLSLIVPLEFLEGLKTSVADILDFLAGQNVQLAIQLWPIFQQDFIRILEAKLSKTLASEESSFTRMCEFLLWLRNRSNARDDIGKKWPLDNVVRPFVASTFQTIASAGDRQAVMLLAKLVSTYGPEAFSSVKLPLQSKGVTAVEDLSAFKLLNLVGEVSSGRDAECSSYTDIRDIFRKHLIPWSLNADRPIESSKLELLLSFFEDGNLTSEWDSVLSYVLGEADTEDEAKGSENLKWIDILAALVDLICQKKNSEDGSRNRSSQVITGPWQSPRLDAAVLTVAQNRNLQHPSCSQLLRNAVGDPNILSTTAKVQVIEVLFNHILLLLLLSESSWARQSAEWIFWQKDNAKFHQPQEMKPLVKLFEDARIAVDILGNSLASILQLGEETTVQVRLLTAFFCLKWTIEKPSSTVSMRNSADDVFEDYETESEHGEAIGIYHDELPQTMLHNSAEVTGNTENELDVGSECSSILSASLKFLDTKEFLSFCRRLHTVFRKSSQKILAQCVRYALLGESYIYCQKLVGQWALDIISNFCIDAEDVQDTLNLLLASEEGWPIWAEVSSIERKSICICKFGKVLPVKTMEINKRFAGFVDTLAGSLGQELIFLGQSALSDKYNLLSGWEVKNLGLRYSRAWLVVELLCTWEWNEGNAIKSVLPFLRFCTNNKHESDFNVVPLDVIEILFHGAFKSCTKIDNSTFNVVKVQHDEVTTTGEPLFRALQGTLKTLFEDNAFWGRAEAESLFFKYFPVEELKSVSCISVTNTASKVLDILMPFLRKKDTVEMGGISTVVTSDENKPGIEKFVCQWLEMALSASMSPSGEKTETESIRWLTIAVSCFPLNSSGGAGTILAASTSEVTVKEKSLLVALFQKQRLQASMPGSHPVAADDFSQENLQTLVLDLYSESILAKLIAAAVAYCWPEFEVEDWKFVLLRLYNWLEAAVVDAEELAEAVADAAREVEGANEHKECSDCMKISAEMAVSKKGKSCSELTSFAVYIFSEIQGLYSLEVGKPQQPLKNLALASWERIEVRALEDILRLFLATGLAESAASFDRTAAEIISVNRLDQVQLWESVADVALNSSTRALESAVRAADLWGVGKGSINALYSLLFSSHPIPSLQWAAYHFLSTDPLRYCAITWRPMKTEQVESSERESEPVVNEDSSITSDANIRPDLAAVLETPAVTLLQSLLTSSSRVNYLLAWSLFLTHLQSLTPLTPARERLVQYTQDSESPNILLDCLFQHISLKKTSSLSASRKRNAKSTLEISEVTGSAKRAAATGSVLFAVEGLWPVKKKEIAILSGAIYGLMLKVLPACVRIWFTGLRDRSSASAIESFTSSCCSPELLAEEFFKVQAVTVTDENLSIRANHSTREVTALYKKEEAGMDIVIKLPACYPLRAVEVECTRRMGISENRLRKWILSMAAFLRNQNGAVAEAILVWKRNVDREFEGVEECPICYSIIHTSNHSLPRLACRTCKHKFHPACLYKWFSTSHKSTCPLCQTPF
ncbi:hypothetical protein O6H91_09G060900 [Diphasiastrum complanatum]|nr:hypothetical protein O6H91_09G060900 [Diphasiastrum complanatum]